MIDRVFVDLDGVLNKFSSYALQYVGATGNHLHYSDYPEDCCTWDIVKSANILKGPYTPIYTNSSFWEALDRNFWATIPVEPYALSLLDYLAAAVGRDNVHIASTATLSAECLAGKMDWIYKYLPTWISRQYMFGRDKFLLAGHGALLIDDNQKNCRKFDKHNGHSILVPRPWNFKRGLHDTDTVSDQLHTYFGGKRW